LGNRRELVAITSQPKYVDVRPVASQQSKDWGNERDVINFKRLRLSLHLGALLIGMQRSNGFPVV